MFNSPRPAQRYTGNSGGGLGGSFVNENPLASSTYDHLDPWSSAPSPSPPPIPAAPSLFSSVIADATVPAIYNKSFTLVDSSNSGETSVSALTRVLETSALPASIIDKIVNLVSSRPRVSKLEFFVALGLVALAQSGKDVSIEQVAALAAQNTLPEPHLRLDSLQPSTSALTSAGLVTMQNSGQQIRAPAPTYSSDDPWTAARLNSVMSPGNVETPANGASSTLSGTGLPKDWWKKQEIIHVNIIGQQGFLLNRHTVYEIATDRGPPVHRRYSEFVFLWDCLVRRYPFRLLPSLPPKRIGPDEQFLEQRRRGLTRFINFAVNHPVIKEDSLLIVFLTEPSFETWRKESSFSLDEESTSKRIENTEEMSIPSDLEEKLGLVRHKINPLIEQWQRICILVERIIRRNEAAAVRFSAFRLPHFSSHVALPSSPSSPPSSYSSARSLASSVLSGPLPLFMSTVQPTAAFFNEQAEMSRLSNTLKVLVEVNEHCWRGDECGLCDGVRQGVSQVAIHTQRQSDFFEQRTRGLTYSTLEALKSQRDLYIAMRDLFVRHDRLSIDQVERLKKRVETTSHKLDGLKAAQKEGWQEEADRLVSQIEKDQATIAGQLNRRIFIRACLWHELRVVMHNRENALLTAAIQTFAREEQDFAERVTATWISLGEAVESMPYE